jgi:hypothetical protein
MTALAMQFGVGQASTRRTLKDLESASNGYGPVDADASVARSLHQLAQSSSDATNLLRKQHQTTALHQELALLNQEIKTLKDMHEDCDDVEEKRSLKAQLNKTRRTLLDRSETIRVSLLERPGGGGAAGGAGAAGSGGAVRGARGAGGDGAAGGAAAIIAGTALQWLTRDFLHARSTSTAPPMQ